MGMFVDYILFCDGGKGVKVYVEVVSVYLGFVVDWVVDVWSV